MLFRQAYGINANFNSLTCIFYLNDLKESYDWDGLYEVYNEKT